ncbi:MAG: DUF1492 domain-containing protein [Ruminococcus sp.]|nr:DUF1492 domain-containing protein [Ruminococcus sp.]
MTDEQKKKTKWLNRVRRANRIAEYWRARLNDAKIRAERTSRSTGNTNGTKVNDTENVFADYVETKAEYEKKLANLNQIRKEVKSVIDSVDDDELHTVLYWHYLKFMTWEQVAEKMHYSVRTIKRKHIRALEKLSPNVIV